ncbi:MAG: pyrroline-5-carboxylate reductase family protein [Anaerolineae bacterium]
MDQFKTQKLAFIGGGHITQIILGNLIKGQVVSPEQVIVSNRSPAKLHDLKAKFGVATTLDNLEALQQADYVFIAVRPENVDSVIQDLTMVAAFNPNQVIISLAAGVPLSRYSRLAEGLPLVRAMPNPPSRIGQGLIALHMNQHVTQAQSEVLTILFSALGQVVHIEEAHFNVITALSSPVATYLFFESLIDAGVRGGLNRSVATQIASQTILGSIRVWELADNKAPHALLAEASTPGGVSVETMFTLEKLGFKPTLMEAIAQGATRAEQVGGDQ